MVETSSCMTVPEVNKRRRKWTAASPALVLCLPAFVVDLTSRLPCSIRLDVGVTGQYCCLASTFVSVVIHQLPLEVGFEAQPHVQFANAVPTKLRYTVYFRKDMFQWLLGI